MGGSMSNIILTGDTSGTLNIAAPAIAGTNTQTLVAATGTLAPLISGTAVTASGTSVNFTDIPSWVKRVTVMFGGVSTNGTSNILIQIGSGSVTTTGYSGVFGSTSFTTGFGILSANALNTFYGQIVITLLSSTTYIGTITVGNPAGGTSTSGGGTSPALSGVLDRVRITTANGTDVFDAGTINILYE